MKTGKILISAIVATSAMTLFSYAVSNSKKKNFREPQLLGQLVERLPNKFLKQSSQITGWGLHYAIGLLFVAIYDKLWKQENLKPSLTSGALLGTASGLIGVIGWKGMFKAHPNPPAKNLKPYFGHLMFAHVVFGVFGVLSYKLKSAKKYSINSEQEF